MKNKLWRHIETPMMTLPILLEKYQRNEFNDTEKGYE